MNKIKLEDHIPHAAISTNCLEAAICNSDYRRVANIHILIKMSKIHLCATNIVSGKYLIVSDFKVHAL